MLFCDGQPAAAAQRRADPETEPAAGTSANLVCGLGNGVFVCAGSAASFAPDFDLLVSCQSGEILRIQCEIEGKEAFFPQALLLFTAFFNDLIGTLFEPQQKTSPLAWHEGGEVIQLISCHKNEIKPWTSNNASSSPRAWVIPALSLPRISLLQRREY